MRCARRARRRACRALASHPDRTLATTYPVEFPLVVDRERARCSAWYELFPRSVRSTPGAHGTLRDCEARLPYVAGMGFDVFYLPPIHPIGRDHRKGRNNALVAAADDVGSPWAIGAAEGGHKAVHPELGTLDDFRRLVARARELGLEMALDIAFQCAPDHPYVGSNPQWFRWRPDGTRAVRRESAEEVPGHLSVRLRIDGMGERCGRARERRSDSGSERACAYSGLTIRTPSRSRSGNG